MMVLTKLPGICILSTLHSDLLMQVVLFWNDLIKPLGHPHPFRQSEIHPTPWSVPQKWRGSQWEWQSL